MIFKISVWYTIPARADLVVESAFILPLMTIWLGNQQKIMSLLTKIVKTHTFISSSQSRDVAVSNVVKPGDTKLESVKIIYLDATESLMYSRALIITQISAVNMDAESGNLMDITVSDGNTSTSHRKEREVRWIVGSILHDWCNKGRGMYYPVCGMMYIK